jgi:hypothetical protein
VIPRARGRDDGMNRLTTFLKGKDFMKKLFVLLAALVVIGCGKNPAGVTNVYYVDRKPLVPVFIGKTVSTMDVDFFSDSIMINHLPEIVPKNPGDTLWLKIFAPEGSKLEAIYFFAGVRYVQDTVCIPGMRWFIKGHGELSGTIAGDDRE